LADSAQWIAGLPDPTAVPSFADNWNMTLSTMALLNYLDGADRQSLFFAGLPEVEAALDSVFLDGDLNGNGVTDATDFTIWRSGFGTAASASPAIGDADGDGAVDGLDFLRWQRGVGGTNLALVAQAVVPEPGACCLLIVSSTATGALAVRRRSRR
jgi:hypothetical protein